MPRSTGAIVQNNFIKGLITDVSALAFPENACVATYDCIFDHDGSVYRRPGIDLEADYTNRAISISNSAIASYLWENVNSQPATMQVLQVGTILYFYRVLDTTLSNDAISSTLDVSAFIAPGAVTAAVAATQCQFASGDGALFVTNQYCDPIYITFDSTLSFPSATRITVRIRDFEGVEDGYATTARPSSLTVLHQYNLYNQGWSASVETTTGADSSPTTNKITTFQTAASAYPSNADVWWLYKDNTDVYNPTTQRIQSGSRGNSPAPKGYFVLDAFNQNRDAASGLVGLPTTTSADQRPQSVAFFAGRVFYAGIVSQRYSSKIYFSKIVEKRTDYGFCYQENDPSAQDKFDILPSDGGVIVVPDIGLIQKLFAVNNHLIVFANNGIWDITGSSGIGFTANDYVIKRISTRGILSAQSFVNIGGYPAWWTADGIYTLTEDRVSGLVVQNITIRRSDEPSGVSDFFDTIPLASKSFAQGSYNPVEKTVQWVYRETAPTNLTERYQYNRIFVLDTISGAFYPWTISSGGGVVCSITCIQHGSITPVFKYPCSSGTSLLTFADQLGGSYRDWDKLFSGSGKIYDSYFVSGGMVHGDAQRKTQPLWCHVFFDTREDTSVMDLWVRRDYAINRNSGRYSQKQRVYLEDDGMYAQQYRRLKLRGNGLIMQFEVHSVDDQPFKLTGWSLTQTVGNAV